MFDLILDRAAVALCAVTPVVFGDKLFEAADLWKFERAVRVNPHVVPAAGRLEGVFYRFVGAASFVVEREAVSHRQGDVGLVVDPPRYGCDGPAGHDFFDEHDTSTDFVAHFSADVESQVKFLEVSMQRNGKSPQGSSQKHEPDEADVRLAAVQVELRTPRHQRLQQFRIDPVIEHCQVAPLGR